jgi:arginine decarboxylase
MADDIAVVWGRGDAGTRLNALDAALAEAGVHDYNLVTYSSIVPAGASVVERGDLARRYPVGAPVGVVLARETSDVTDETVAAGLGWVEAEEGGVFMESAAASARACRTDLRRKLADAKRLREWTWRGDPETRVVEHAVDGVGAAVVAAVFGRLAYAPGSGSWDATEDI